MTVFIHCGWMKTGTTSLQLALRPRLPELEASGLVGAAEWRVLKQRLSGEDADSAIAEFTSYVQSQDGRDVVLSCETFMDSLLIDRKKAAFLRLVRATMDVAPVTCVWTLRRWDELMRSHYLWQLSFGLEPMPLSRFLHRYRPDRMERLVVGLQETERATGGNTIYCKYDRAGTHNDRLMRIFGVPSRIADEVGREMSDGPRRNAAPTYKEAVVLLNLEPLSVRAGVELSRPALITAFDEGGFRFEDDRPCGLFSLRERRALHETVLGLARKHDFQPYIRFFGQEEVVGAPTADRLDPDAVSDRDLNRLVGYLERADAGTESRTPSVPPG